MPGKIIKLCVEKAVPDGHVYKKLVNVLDFEEIQNRLDGLSAKEHQSSEVLRLFKCLFLQFLENHSDIKLENCLQENVASRWFCGYELDEKTPDKTVFAKTRKMIGIPNILELFNILLEQMKAHKISGAFDLISISDFQDKIAVWEKEEDGPCEKRQNIDKASRKKGEVVSIIFKDEVENDDIKKFVTAAEKGLVETVQELLKNPEIDPNEYDIRGYTALTAAVEENHIDVVRLLLSHSKTDPNRSRRRVFDARGIREKAHEESNLVFDGKEMSYAPPIFWASGKGKFEIVKELLKNKKTDINAQSSSGKTALMEASWHRNVGIAKAFLAKEGVDINVQDRFGNAVLMDAVFANSIDIVRALLAKKTLNINAQNWGGKTALTMAVEDGKIEIIKELLKCHNIDFCLQDYNGDTVLMHSLHYGCFETVKELLKSKEVGINIKNKNGLTAIFLTVMGGNFKLVKELLKHKDIDPDIFNAAGKTVLMEAVLNEQALVVKELLASSKVDLNITNKSFDETAFILAARWGSEEIAKAFLMRDDLDFNKQDCVGYTALMTAAKLGRAKIAWLFLQEMNSDHINFQNEKGETALMMAVDKGHEGVVREFLLKKELDVNVQNKEGETALHIAIGSGRLNIFKLLLKNENVDPNICNKYRVTPLVRASSSGRYDFVKELLLCPKIGFDADNGQGRKAIICAAKKGNLDIVNMLLKHANIAECVEASDERPMTETVDQILQINIAGKKKK